MNENPNVKSQSDDVEACPGCGVRTTVSCGLPHCGLLDAEKPLDSGCSECGKSSTPDWMWALYCLECIETKIAPALAAPSLPSLPPLGAPYEGGIFAGLTTRPDGTHCAVVLLPDLPAKPLPWKAAMAWAKDLDAELPTRPVSALLFANVRAAIEREWHWTCEEADGSYAWSQVFDDGYQTGRHKSYEGRARAVRLIPIGGTNE